MPSYRIPAVLIVCLTVHSAAFANPASTLEHITVDVFTTSTQHPVAVPENNDSLSVAIHELDGIVRFNTELSAGLANDPKLAKQQVLRRFKSIDKSQQDGLQQSAEALALAVQLGVHRYPAIVLNTHWVIYGVLDVQAAIGWYRSWRQGTTR